MLQNLSTRGCKLREVDDKVSKKCNGCNPPTHGFRQGEKLCPAWGKKCLNCGKNNHFAYCCKLLPSKESPSGNQSTAAAVDEGSSALAAMGGVLPTENVSSFFTYSNELRVQEKLWLAD